MFQLVQDSTSATFVIQERPAHTWTWNLKAALGPKPCKVHQHYRHTNLNQHMLAEEVPNNTNKNRIPALRSQLSNHVQSVASPQYKHQLKCAWRRSSVISAFSLVYIQLARVSGCWATRICFKMFRTKVSEALRGCSFSANLVSATWASSRNVQERRRRPQLSLDNSFR